MPGFEQLQAISQAVGLETIRQSHLCYHIESKYLPYVNGIYRILRGNTNGITGDVSRNAQQVTPVIQLEEPSGTI